MVSTPRIALIGFMGSGKTQVGSILAKKIGYRFVDLDRIIEEEEGLTIREMFEKFGESYFREKEKEILKRFSEVRQVVAATGGGIIEDDENRKILKDKWFTVYLDVPFETAFERIRKDKNRPKAQGGRERVKILFEERKRLYRDSSHMIVYTKDLTPAKVTNYIQKKLREM